MLTARSLLTQTRPTQLQDRYLGGGYDNLHNREGLGEGGRRETGQLSGGGDAPAKMCGVGLHIDAPTEGGGADNLLPFIEHVVEGGAAAASRKVVTFLAAVSLIDSLIDWCFACIDRLVLSRANLPLKYPPPKKCFQPVSSSGLRQPKP